MAYDQDTYDVGAVPGIEEQSQPLVARFSTEMAPTRPTAQTLDVTRAQKIIKAFTDDPSWLADPRTAHAANSVFSAASRVIGMNMQLERVAAQGEAARIRTDFTKQKFDDLSKVTPFIPADDVEGQAELGRLNGMVGQPNFDLQAFSTGVARLQSKYKKPLPEFQSSAGKEVADRMELEKKFGVDSPEVKKFDALTASPLSDLGKLLRERDAASGAERELYDKRIAGLSKSMGFTIQYDDQGRPIVNYGPQETSIGAPSVATQSMAQRKLLKYEAASELINHLQRDMQSGHVGVAGVLGEYVGDRLLPQLGVDSFKGKRADVRSTLMAARESLLREISDDTRFSNIDREEISKALPSSGVFESLQNAQQRLATVRNILNARGRTYSQGLGLPRPEWSLTPDEIKAQFDKYQATGGKEGMSFEKAKSLLERFH